MVFDPRFGVFAAIQQVDQNVLVEKWDSLIHLKGEYYEYTYDLPQILGLNLGHIQIWDWDYAAWPASW
jgi:hypothetical protein